MLRPMRALLLLLLLLLFAAPAAAGELVTFAPRGDVQVGWSFVETSTWTVTGANDVKVAGATVRKGPIDRLSSHTVSVRVDAVEEGRPSAMSATIVEQVSREDGEAEALEIDGLALTVVGRSGDRDIDRVDGKRLKKKQRKWLDRQFGGSEDGQDIDPIALLIPDGPVEVGSTWDLSLSAIQGYFGERFVLDRAASHARTTLVSIETIDGVPSGAFAFDVLIVPSSMKNAEITEASMAVVGTAHVPVQGDLPYFDYDVQTDLRFLGAFMRGPIKAQVDLSMAMHGVDARRAE